MGYDDQNHSAGKPQMNKQQEKRQKLRRQALITAVAIYLVLAMALYIIVNVTAISSIFTKIANILAPLFIGISIAYLINPILRAFERHVFKNVSSFVLRRTFSMILTYLLVILFIALFVFLLMPEISDSINELISHFNVYIQNAITMTNNLINRLFSFMGNQEYQEYVKSEEISKAISDFFTGTGSIFETIIRYIQTYGSKIVVSFTNILIGIFVSIYILASKEKRYAQTSKFFHAILKDKQYKLFYETMSVADKSFGGFIEGKIIDSLIIGVLTFIILTIFKMPYTALISVIVGVTNIIPYFGPFIGAIPSAFIILIAEPVKTIPFIIIIIVIQQLDGNVIGPKILGNNTGLSSLGIILAILIMSGLFGVPGMIIGVPVGALVVSIITRYLEYRLKRKGKSFNTDDYYKNKEQHRIEMEKRKNKKHLLGTLNEKISSKFEKLFHRKAAEPVEQTEEEGNEQDDDGDDDNISLLFDQDDDDTDDMNEEEPENPENPDEDAASPRKSPGKQQ